VFECVCVFCLFVSLFNFGVRVFVCLFVGCVLCVCVCSLFVFVNLWEVFSCVCGICVCV